MPEFAVPKLRHPPPPPETTRLEPHEAGEYAELDVVTNFAFLRGASHPDELIYRATELGYKAIAITDLNSLAGIVRAFDACKQVSEQGGRAPKLIVGTRLTFTDGTPDLLVHVMDRSGYAWLCRLLTIGKRRTEKGQCWLTLADFAEHNEGMLAAIASDPVNSKSEISNLREILGDRLSLASSCLHGPDDVARLEELNEISRRYQIPLLATNNVHYHVPQRRPLQDVLVCIRHICTIAEAGYRLFPNAERYLKSPGQMRRLFANYPQAIERGLELAERCTFSLEELRYEYPHELVPAGKTALEHLTDLTWRGAAKRYPQGIPEKVVKQINHELKLIAELKFEPYFLTVQDLVRFARHRGILCQGRGSAANSAVCYCIGVTSVDPARIDVLFERFVSAARGEPPDIDIDFEHERREEVIQYIYEKYGRERAGMTAEVITYRGRSAVRDVGKALGLSLDLVDQMAKKLDWWHLGSLSEGMLNELNLNPGDPTIRRVIDITTELLGFPRHLGQHVGGMVMTHTPLCELVPIENASMPNRTVIEWDKDDIDTLGILKVDALALGMLTCISRAFRLINERHEGTEARRHEGSENAGEEGNRSHERDQNVSGFDCVAESDGISEDGIPSNGKDAGIGEIRAHDSNEKSSCVHSFEHSRGLCAADDGGLHQVSEDGARIYGGTVDATGDSNWPDHAFSEPAIDRFAGRDGPCIAGPDPQPSEQALQNSLIESQHESLNPSPLTSCLVTEHRHEGTKAHRHEGSDEGKEGSSTCSLHPLPLTSCLHASVPSCLELHNIPPEDPLVYDMISDADTIGVFQVESRAQMTMLPRLRPRSFYDLVIEVAIVRPGPIQGNMVHPYLRRRNGEEPVTYPSEAIREVLEKTLGVPLFQEQAMKLTMVGAGFSAGDADRLRRAMATWRKGGLIEEFHDKIINGMLANGYTHEFAEQCFSQIRGFGLYGFPESHAASFALLVYISSWLKRYYPAAFCAALLNSQPMGFYAPAQIVQDAQQHGVSILPCDINISCWDCLLEDENRHEGTKARRHEVSDKGREGICTCLLEDENRHEGTKAHRHEVSDEGREGIDKISTLSLNPAPLPSCLRAFVPSCLSHDKSTWGQSGPAVRLGFRQIKGLRIAHAQTIIQCREKFGPFKSIEHFQQLTRLPRHAMHRLAEADAFFSLNLTRRQALWQVLALDDRDSPLFDDLPAPDCVDPNLPTMPLGQEVMTDYSTIGLSLKEHPVALVRQQLAERKITPAGQVQNMPYGRWVRVAGLVLIRQRPGTASGIVFETLEDETGIVNLIVRPNIYDKYRLAARHSALLQAEGYVERQGQVVHVMAWKLEDLSHLLAGYRFVSRDFH